MPVTRVPLGARHGEVVVRHTDMVWGLGTIVFIHGLGDSRQCFLEAFEIDGLQSYNMIVPDLPGSGNSAGGEELSISSILSCLEGILDHFRISEYFVVGHGLGADLAVWLASRSRGRKGCCGLIAVEGTLGEESLLYADMAIAAADDPSKTYVKWFQTHFIEGTIMTPNMGKEPAWRRYYESLCMCKPWAFLALAREMRNNLHTADGEVQAFRALQDLDIPKYYCYAENGHCDEQTCKALLEKANIRHLRFAESTHWLMGEHPSAFYAFLLDFVRKNMPQPTPTHRVQNWFLGRWRAWLDDLPPPVETKWWKKRP